jgi:hypothetical protein
MKSGSKQMQPTSQVNDVFLCLNVSIPVVKFLNWTVRRQIFDSPRWSGTMSPRK